METKRGISLVILVIAIIVISIITGMIISGTDNVLKEANKDEFVVEISTIEEKIEEYYLLVGSLPVRAGVQYTAEQVIDKLVDTEKQKVLTTEIITNNDEDNMFLVVDLGLMGIQTNERGKSQDTTDIFVVASNTLNVYYLNGVEYDNIMRFSLATLVTKNDVVSVEKPTGETVNLNNELNIQKDTNIWTNTIKLIIKNDLGQNESLKYSIGGATSKNVADSNVISINSENMTGEEKSTFSTNKQVVIDRIVSEEIIETVTVNISNLDIISPTVGELELIDTTNEAYNIIKINSADEGDSGVKCLYYDYDTVIIDNTSTNYYSDKSEVTESSLIQFGRTVNDGRIKLDKNVKSIVVIAVDNAGNTSTITTYTIDDTYVISK